MNNEKGYQGWSSYSTWVVHLWMSNEEDTYRYWREKGREISETFPASVELVSPHQQYKTARVALADDMNEHYKEEMPELDGMWGDLLSSALGEVDWFEIADSILEE